ncbi:membrane-associated guanylate kinase, WW and PDZ domain-containing protein 1-like isoform X2 [Argiope bruennichi]|uniref:membrane-associated guanylate kinase, WW and PDZ domain-containing protein 1-like isoform X2 n=1 Tax=Argiope bruennichi TaxID=94029 RepID=UPI0024947B3D|nr:membrane-associated guanylate kinase, WW and PDZ domain-containing protein 1-like isoform X2 [Argiope bruennichi]
MLRASANRPITPNKLEAETNLLHGHWSKAVYESFFTSSSDDTLDLTIEGGSDNGQFPFIGYVPATNRSISKGDILLEVQGQKIVGYTQRDVLNLLKHYMRNGNSVPVKAVKAGYLTKDLRNFLNTRFQKGSVDHDLQNTIRDNLYQRTVPCTTRPPRVGEISGVDYTFLSVEEFIALERSGSLLESGIYEGNHYGTPMPPKDNYHSPMKRSNSIGPSNSLVLPGAHASSEGKRRRNRSNVEAMASKTADVNEFPVPVITCNTRSSTPVSGFSYFGYQNCNSVTTTDSLQCSSAVCDLGPLPENWEKAFTSNGEPYFIDHNTGTSQWLDPRLSRIQKKTIEDCGDDELPFGWERIDDPHYGTYYIDHVNRRTQYENPVIQARKGNDNVSAADISHSSSSWHRHSDQTNHSNHAHSLLADVRSGHWTRNSSLTQTSNCSNSNDPNPLASTNNSESFLIASSSDGNSSSSKPPPPLSSPTNNISSSPAATHRFPYLHCIPCLNEKHEPSKHLADSKVAEGNMVIGNGAVTTNPSTSDSGSRMCDGLKGQSSVSTERSSLTPGRQSFFQNSGSNDLSHRHSSISEELCGTFITTSLVKSSRGLGFTIVGGGSGTVGEEFLQIKDVVPNGPAWCNGKLLTGDVLVRVNGECVLGYTHENIIALFQTIPAGEVVQLEVCRGYPLPFDPSDPNTEIVTTVAVSLANSSLPNNPNVYSFKSENCHLPNKLTDNCAKPTDSMTRAVKSMPDLSSKLSDVYHPSRNNSAGLLNPFVEDMPNHASISVHSSFAMPEFLTVEIIKGAAGFGFTIADSSYGQKVKKILDRPRCKQLQENDLLCAINGHDVRALPHTDVVQLLKDCPCNEAAEIIVQRGGFFSPARNKGRSKRLSEEVAQYNSGTLIHSPSFNNSHLRLNGKTNGSSYRSKTPTAELYSSRDKEPVMVARPKTPLVDTRNWSMSSSEQQNNNGNKFMPNSDHEENPLYNATSTDYSISNRDLLECSPERHGNPSWYSDQGRGRDWHNHNYRDSSHLNEEDDSFSKTFVNNPLSDNAQQSFTLGLLSRSTSHETPRKPSIETNKYFNNYDSWRDMHRHDSNVNNFMFQPLSNGNNSGLFNNSLFSLNEDRFSNRNSNSNFMHNQSFYSSNVPTYHMQSLSLSNVGSSGISSIKDSLQYNDMYSNTMQKHFPISTSSNTSRLDPLIPRKHGTSFEHEQPMPYFSNDYRNAYQNSLYKVDESKENCINYIDLTVTLHRQENGFGFRIIGGTEEGSQVAVGHIVPGGAADLDGTLKSGDEIVGVNGQSVLNSPHHHVVQLMSAAAENGNVTLNIRRPLFTPENSNSSSKPINVTGPYDVTVTRNANEGFGFVIISSKSKSGSTIGRIIEGSPAERCGLLHVGDIILAVNGISIINMSHGEIVNLIKDCGYSVTLTIDEESSNGSLSQKGDDVSLDQEEFYQTVFLQRGTKGFGFSIRGGKEFHNMPLFVLRIAENGPAQQDGKLKVGDQIIEINGVCTKDMTHAEAIELIRKEGNSARLLIKRTNYTHGSLE